MDVISAISNPTSERMGSPPLTMGNGPSCEASSRSRSHEAMSVTMEGRRLPDSRTTRTPHVDTTRSDSYGSARKLTSSATVWTSSITTLPRAPAWIMAFTAYGWCLVNDATASMVSTTTWGMFSGDVNSSGSLDGLMSFPVNPTTQKWSSTASPTAAPRVHTPRSVLSMVVTWCPTRGAWGTTNMRVRESWPVT